jgi:hypothetical protein
VGPPAAIRPESWNIPLFIHVFGAMILVGGMLAGASGLAFARGSTRLLRLGYYSLLAVSFPGWIVMFLGAEWIYRREGLDHEPIDSAWVLTGFLVAEVGGVLLLVTLILGGIGARRLRRGDGAGLLKATMILSLILLAANVVAVWAMAGKPD